MNTIFKKLKFFIFFNTLSVKTNLLYKIYFLLSKLNFFIKKNNSSNQFINEINILNKNFYFLLKNVYSLSNKEEIIREIVTCFQKEENLLKKKRTNELEKISTDMLNPLKLNPNIINKIISEKIINFLKHYFKSFIKIYSIHIYRTSPNINYINPSFLWHFDNVPFCSVKCMILLTDVDSTNGAMKIMSGNISKKTINNKFYDRNLYSNEIDKKINKSDYDYACGSAGDAFFFHNGRCLHKATNPISKSRIVIVVDFVPSFHEINHKDLLKPSHFFNSGIYVNPFTNKIQDKLV